MEQVRSQLKSIVGTDYVFDDPHVLQTYTENNISFLPARNPLMVVQPANAEELIAIVRLAGLTHTPITPSSSPQAGHGGSIPCIPGITLDMQRLNRIQLIDTNSRNAIIEPGVTFDQLQQAANAEGLRVLTPIDLPARSSVLSSYLELTPLFAWPKYGTESILSMDFVLPTGELVQTGAACLPVFNEKPYMPLTTVPAYMEKVWFGAQGTLGVATRAVVKLKTDYERAEVWFAPFANLPASLPAIKAISRLGHAVEFFAANATYLAALLASPEAEFDALRSALPNMTLVMVLRGEEQRVAYQREDIVDLATEFGFELCQSVAGLDDCQTRVLNEIKTPQGYNRFSSLRGAYHSIPFMCTAKQVPMFCGVLPQISGAFAYEPDRVGQLLLPVEPTRFHFQYSFFSDPHNSQEHLLVQKLHGVWSSTLIKMGAFFSRPYGPWATQLFAKATAYKELLKEFKNTIDPDNIMNPGKLDL